jgi:hypothetical protein
LVTQDGKELSLEDSKQDIRIHVAVKMAGHHLPSSLPYTKEHKKHRGISSIIWIKKI